MSRSVQLIHGSSVNNIIECNRTQNLAIHRYMAAAQSFYVILAHFAVDAIHLLVELVCRILIS